MSYKDKERKRAYDKARYEANRETVLARVQDYYYANRDACLDRSRANYRIRKFDLKPETFKPPSHDPIKITIIDDLDLADLLQNGTREVPDQIQGNAI